MLWCHCRNNIIILIAITICCDALEFPSLLPKFNKPVVTYDYDLIVIGAGASGLFAAGTSSSLGYRTLLIDKLDVDEDVDTTENSFSSSSSSVRRSKEINSFHVGGDCTNAACVPSKAVRSAARVSSLRQKLSGKLYDNLKEKDNNNNIIMSSPSTTTTTMRQIAREHAANVVSKVRERESVEGIAQSSNKLNVCFAETTNFISPNTLSLSGSYNTSSLDSSSFGDHDKNNTINVSRQENIQVTGRKFLIATGAGPVIPQSLGESAKKVGLPLLTYRSLLKGISDNNGPLNTVGNQFWNMNDTSTIKHVVVVGGGATSCELTQSVARLSNSASSPEFNITVVAPTLLPSEDITARIAVKQLLQNDGVNLLLGTRALTVEATTDNYTNGNKAFVVLNDGRKILADMLIVATGRQPGEALSQLNLEKAGISWTWDRGVEVNNRLQSKTAAHVYAAGDCANAIPLRDRRAHHAGWTGFHAVRNALFPFFLRSKAVHSFVPRVTFTDPEIASVGMSRIDCIRKYGDDNFIYMKISEEGSDRADQDSIERAPNIGFVNIQVHKYSGRILGGTACSPSASETINEVGLALQSKTSIETFARAIHAYPSHGYLLYRLAVAIATSSTWGLLAACGPFGRFISATGKFVSSIFSWKSNRKPSKAMREWQAVGADNIYNTGTDEHSFLDASKNDALCNVARDSVNNDNFTSDVDKELQNDFVRWLNNKP